MAKNGKFFANSSESNSAGNTVIALTIKGAALTSVTNALDILTVAIRRTIDEGLKTVKEAMKINANDNL